MIYVKTDSSIADNEEGVNNRLTVRSCLSGLKHKKTNSQFLHVISSPEQVCHSFENSFLNMASTLFLLIKDGIIDYANNAVPKAFDYYDVSQVEGFPLHEFIFGCNERDTRSKLHKLAQQEIAEDVAFLKADGSKTHYSMRSHRVGEIEDRTYLVEAIGIDRAIKAEEKGTVISFYDPQTGLPNKGLLDDRLEIYMARAIRAAHGNLAALQHKICIMSIELENLHLVAMEFGDEAVDHIIENIGLRLITGLRRMDTVARVSENELTILISDISNLDDAEITVRRVMGLLYEPIIVGGHEVVPTFSMGVSIFPDHGAKTKELISIAEQCREKARESGSNQYVIFSAEDEDFEDSEKDEHQIEESTEGNEEEAKEDIKTEEKPY